MITAAVGHLFLSMSQSSGRTVTALILSDSEFIGMSQQCLNSHYLIIIVKD